MKKFVGLRTKTYSILKESNDEDKKAKGTKKCVIKRKLNLKEFEKNKLILKTQQRFKIERHKIFTDEIDKIAWSSIDDKIMQSIDSTETYAYGTSKDKRCKDV